MGKRIFITGEGGGTRMGEGGGTRVRGDGGGSSALGEGGGTRFTGYSFCSPHKLKRDQIPTVQKALEWISRVLREQPDMLLAQVNEEGPQGALLDKLPLKAASDDDIEGITLLLQVVATLAVQHSIDTDKDAD